VEEEGYFGRLCERKIAPTVISKIWRL